MNLQKLSYKSFNAWLRRPRLGAFGGHSFASFISISAGMAFILIAGPNLQTFVLGTATSNEASIYDAAYGGSINSNPSAAEWFSALITSPIFFASLFICFTSLRKVKARAMFFAAAVSGFLAWTVIDIYYLTIDGWSTELFLQCVLANIFGGAIIGGALLLGVNAQRRTKLFLKDSGYFGNLAGLTAPFFLGFSLSLAAFIAANLFYVATPSDIDIRFTLPAEGTYKAKLIEEEERPFGIFRRMRPISSDIKWIGVSDNAYLRWTNTANSKYFVSIHIFEGCAQESAIDELLLLPPTLERMVLDDAQLEFSDGLTDARVLGVDSQYGEMSFTGDQLRRFRIGELNDDGRLATTLMPDENGVLRHINPGGATHYYISALLIGDENRASRQSREEFDVNVVSRSLTLTIGGQSRTVAFEPPKSFDRKKKIGCKLIDLGSELLEWPDTFMTGELAAGAILTIEPSDSLWNAAERNATYAEIGGISGWISTTTENHDELAGQVDGGAASVLLARGALQSGHVDGVSLTLQEDSSIQAYGNLYVQVLQKGALTVSGEANGIFLDGRRMNQTRWEKLDWQARLLIIGGLPAFFAYLFSIVRALLKSNRSMRP